MATLEEVIKSPARSKTIGLNAGLMLLLLIPQVKDFVSNNPVSVPYALAAANIVLRFSTSGRISLFPGTAAGKTMGGSSWWLPVIIGVAGLAVFWTEALPGLVG